VGLTDALRRAGARPGDEVAVGAERFEYQPPPPPEPVFDDDEHDG
jgi:hypothetical protein